MNWVSLKLNIYSFKNTIQESERKGVVWKIFVIIYLANNFFSKYKTAYKSTERHRQPL